MLPLTLFMADVILRYETISLKSLASGVNFAKMSTMSLSIFSVILEMSLRFLRATSKACASFAFNALSPAMFAVDNPFSTSKTLSLTACLASLYPVNIIQILFIYSS